MSVSIFFSDPARAMAQCTHYMVSPGKTLQGVQLQLQGPSHQGFPVAVMLPQGFRHEDGSFGQKVFETDADGKIDITGVTCEAGTPTGQYLLIAECQDGHALAEIFVQADIIPLKGQVYQTVIDSKGVLAYVVSQDEDRRHYVAVIEIASKSVIAEIVNPVRSPEAIALSPDDKYLYVCDRLARKLLVIDTQTLDTIAEGTLDRAGTRMQVHPDGNIAYISSANFIMVVDLNTLNTIEYIFLDGTAAIIFNPNGRAYALFITIGGSRIAVIDSQTHQIVTRLSLGGYCRKISISPDKLSLYAAIYTKSETDIRSWIVVIDTLVDGFKNNIEHGRATISELGISSDGKTLYAANTYIPEIYAIDIQSQALETIPLGHGIQPYNISTSSTQILGGDLEQSRLFVLNIKSRSKQNSVT
ncbi:hypothetical protein PS858_01008 [Pseudomonas fluorescens]|jgi:DNA-binding beta-propeller fold protein YncE|uniref:YncE family protein n=1 Tax=Pseudomonas fluorescens TaxID=294 RepID=UPI0012412EEB|nr:hypothetical protein [Pseudomonas fluorescens]VVO65376.1 hypothetical protein PS858_01008 [Pseudomonas fluorescens]